MTADGKEIAQPFLRPEEIQALKVAENLYGVQAKLAAGDLLANLNIERGSAEQIMGRLSVGLEQMDFEQKREVRDGFRQLGRLFGQIALGEEVHVVPLTAAVVETQKRIEIKPEPKPSKREKTPFGIAQKNFLEKVFGTGNSEIIEDLSHTQVRSLARELAERYVKLNIRRLGPQAKKDRAQQMHAFLVGEPLENIATRFGKKKEVLRIGINNMTGSITSRIEESELTSILASVLKE